MLDIHELTVDYGKHRALDAINLRVQPKELVRATHGSFDNNIEVVSHTLRLVTGRTLALPVDDLRGF